MTNNNNRNQNQNQKQNQNQNQNQKQNQNDMREEFGSTFDVDKLKEQTNTKQRKNRF
ncbi:hypothetical protein ACFSFY_15735 [Sporosarcina siberiensis]|uniref:Small, acid-soluble spore protein gamma-type n=1 Tax=Sporosarcina siberiensis TaxID=1365606 RepID=A0ABW4SJ01_9BACL